MMLTVGRRAPGSALSHAQTIKTMTTPLQARLFLEMMDVPRQEAEWQPWLILCCELMNCAEATLVCWKTGKPSEREIFSTAEWKKTDFDWVDFADLLLTRTQPEHCCFLSELLGYDPASSATLNTPFKHSGDAEITTLMRPDHLAAVVDWSDKRGIFILRKNTDWHEQDKKVVMQLLPFINKTIQMKRQMERQKMALFLSKEILNSAPRGIAILLANGLIGYANTKARKILDARDGVAELDGKIRFNDTDDHLTIFQQLKKICDPENHSPDADGFDISIARPSDKAPYQMGIRRLVEDPGSVDTPDALKRAVCYMHDPAEQSPLITDQLKRFYSLTDAQAALAAVMYEGESVNSASRRLGISVNTSRTHLRRIYAKIGAANQAEFLQEMARSLKLTNRPNN
jgi:DNA-binding CsgD family transcriptional regulator